MVKFNEEAQKPKTKRRVTQQEIADIAGVSHVAVSYALHRKLQTRISKEKQQEILRIAESLGYQPRAMTTYSIGLALAVRSLRLDITGSIIQYADEALRQRGYRLTLATYDDDYIPRRGYFLDPKNCDGVLLTEPLDDVSSTISPELPRVMMADAEEKHLEGGLDQVSLDTRETLRSVVAYAVKHGHTRLGLVISVLPGVYDNHLRESFKAALKEHNIPASHGSLIEIGTKEATAGPLLKCMSSANAPTLIIAGSSARAQIVLNTLQWASYKVPDDVSLISLIDSERLPQLLPAVTATTAAGYDVVSLAIERLVQRIENQNLPQQRIQIAGTLIERGSVKTLVH